MTLSEVVVHNIKRYRKLKGITQEQLASKCNTSTSYIGLLETKKKNPQLATVERIAKALAVTPQLLFEKPIVENQDPTLDVKDKILGEIDSILRKHITENISL